MILSLASVLFKSYIRAGSRGRSQLGFLSQPRVMFLVDLIAFLAPFIGLFYGLQILPENILILVGSLAVQAIISLPVLLTSAVIAAGILFELGQSAGLSSSEAVNWLPITTREYVASSSLSILTVYSPFLALSAGLTLSLSLQFGLIVVCIYSILLSVVAMILGAFMVEMLKAVMNKVSSSVYGRSGTFGIISRLIILIVLFVLIQLAFNPYILYSFLGVVVSGVDLVWFIPMIWPSVALIDQLRSQFHLAAIFSLLFFGFTAFTFELASRLRLRYWAPIPVSIAMGRNAGYSPSAYRSSFPVLSPLEAAIALKEFRALVRRRDMARFIAIPVVLVISFFLPVMLSGDSYSGRSPGLFLAAYVPFLLPLMLSTIVVGQEGKAIANILMLPIRAKDFIIGKLLPAWIISTLATFVSVGVFEIIAPTGVIQMAATIIAGLLTIASNGFLGLGIGVRHPDFTQGSRSRYVTMNGFLLGLLIGALMTIAIFAPIAVTLVSSGGILGQAPFSPIGLSVTLPLTIVIGSALSYLSYKYCKNGVEGFLTNFEA